MINCLRLNLALVAIIAVCGCQKPATESNFRSTINDWFAKHPVCSAQALHLENAYPVDFLDLLVNKGLMTKSRGIDHFGQTYNYDLTSQGNTLVSAKDPTHLCYGFKQVDTIQSFTVPTDSGLGKSTEVSYTWKLTGVPDWVRGFSGTQVFYDAGFAERLVAQSLSGKLQTPDRSEKALLVLTNKGWKITMVDRISVSDE